LQDCCLLGTADHGCGPLARDWIIRNNHTYLGRAVVEGVETDGWDGAGNGPNKYYQTVGPNPVPVKLVQLNPSGSFLNVYDRESYYSGPINSDVFAVPETCSVDKKCKSQMPCSLGAADAKDLQRAKTKVPRASYKGSDFPDMTAKLNSVLKEYENVRECASWTLSELHQFQFQLLKIRSPELDEVYQSTDDNRRLAGDAAFYAQKWSLLSNVSASLTSTYQQMHRDGHCHEAVMWFVHHTSAPLRQTVAKTTGVPMLPHGAHTCLQGASSQEKVVCEEYSKLVSCQNCHGDPKAVIV